MNAFIRINKIGKSFQWVKLSLFYGVWSDKVYVKPTKKLKSHF